MAHGTRGRWLRVAGTGFGVVLCTGLAGCMNTDKPKDKGTVRQPGPGLTGTPMLPSGAGAGAVGRTGQPGGQFAGAGANLQPAGGFQPAPGTVAGQQRFGSTGQNTNTSGQPPAYNYAAAPGAAPINSAPTQPGYAQPIQPAAGTAPSQYLGGGATPTPPVYASPPPLVDMPLPPPMPLYGSAGGAELPGGVLPPVPAGPMAPLTPTPPPGATGKGPQLFNFSSGVFGSQ